METKHTLQDTSYTGLMEIIMDCNLDIRVEREYDALTDDYGTMTLVGDEDHVHYLIHECL